MTAYVTIPNSDVDPESPITTSLMVALRDNPTAITEKSSGAPVLATDYIVTSMILDENVTTPKIEDGAVTADKLNAASVSQSILKTATSEFSTTGSGVNISLPGGEYGFFVELKNGDWETLASGSTVMRTVGSTYLIDITLAANLGGTANARQRYVQSSPPYNLGYGDIPLFIFLFIDSVTNKILGTYSAPEAPWHNNGPTNIRPDFLKNGKPYKIIRNNNDDINNIDNPVKRKIILSKIKKKKVVLINQAYKNKDMDIIPHPFTGNKLTDRNIVLLDPLSSAVKDLLQFHEDGESIGNILHNGYIKINKTGLDVKSPKGVLTVKATWKKT